MQKEPSLAINKIYNLFNYLSTEFLGGPKILKFAWIINFQKAGTFIFVALLMIVYNNFSTAAWVYLGLHGTYGLCWLLKHFVFPDPGWEKKITLGGAAMSFLFVLGPYWLFPFLLISDILGPNYTGPTNSTLMFSISIHTLGVVIMMVSDSQKYFMLKYKKGLIVSGMFRYVRRPNYLGEIMVYGSYALMVGHWIPWLILAWVWIGIFRKNIKMIEVSLSRYAEWEKYKNSTSMLIPFKLFARKN